jgi:hypothetical protein
MAYATPREMDQLDAVIANAERLIAGHDRRTAVALIKGIDTDDLEDLAQHMRAALARLRLQRQELAREAARTDENKAA